jgi:endonuclease YncB( thermonuclease family)
MPTVRNVTPPGITPGPAVTGPLIREPTPTPAAQPARWQRFFLPETSDAATFHVLKRTIHIAGISVPAAKDTCTESGGATWPCGQTALHSLRMFLRGRPIECFYPYVDTAVEITAPCRVGKADLGSWLLTQGWARPGEYATDAYVKASAAARCAKRGIWRGTTPDTSCAVTAKQ